MIRYWFYTLLLIAGIVFLCIMSGIHIFAFVDFLSLIIVGIFPFLFVSILFGFKNMLSALSICFKKDAEKDKLTMSYNLFKLYGKIIWLTGFIAVIIIVISMLTNLDDRSILGPKIAISLISLLYSGLLNIVIIIPFTALIKNKLKE